MILSVRTRTLPLVKQHVVRLLLDDDPVGTGREKEIEDYVNGVFNGDIYDPILDEILKSSELEINKSLANPGDVYLMPSLGLAMCQY